MQLLMKKIITLIQEKLNHPKKAIFIKPDADGRGIGINSIESNELTDEKNIITSEQKNKIFKAIQNAFEVAVRAQPILIQESVDVGQEYRFYVLHGTVCSVYRRSAPFVIGDGIQTVKQLIDKENSTKWHRDINSSIIVDDDLLNNLKKLT